MSPSVPKYTTIPEWMAMSGMRRNGVYEAIARGDLRAKKLGKRTLIDVDRGLAYLDSLPEANIKMGRHSERFERTTRRVAPAP